MLKPKQHAILLVGVDEEVRPDLATAFEARGSGVYWIDVPFTVSTDGSGVVSTESEAGIIEELDRQCQSIGRIDVLVNCVSFNVEGDSVPRPSFAAIHAAALMQLSRPLKAVLPGMIIRQKGHIIALVARGSDRTDSESYDAAASAAATISHRINEAVNGDNIRSDVLLHQGSYIDPQKMGFIETLVKLAIPKAMSDCD